MESAMSSDRPTDFRFESLTNNARTTIVCENLCPFAFICVPLIFNLALSS